MASMEFPKNPDYTYLDDYTVVVDYPPGPFGSCRIHTIRSSGCKCILGAPCGTSYVFVQGKDSACIVTTHGDDKTRNSFFHLEKALMGLADPRFKGKLNYFVAPASKKHGDLDHLSYLRARLSNYLGAPVSEKHGDSDQLNYVGAPVSEEHGDLDHFAVVSAVVTPEDVSMIVPPEELNKEVVFEFHEETFCHPNQAAVKLVKEASGTLEKEAINFLKENLENDSPFTLEKTIQTAISGLQCLYDKKFQAGEIRVFVVGELGGFRSLLPMEEIMKHLTAINSP